MLGVIGTDNGAVGFTDALTDDIGPDTIDTIGTDNDAIGFADSLADDVGPDAIATDNGAVGFADALAADIGPDTIADPDVHDSDGEDRVSARSGPGGDVDGLDKRRFKRRRAVLCRRSHQRSGRRHPDENLTRPGAQLGA